MNGTPPPMIWWGVLQQGDGIPLALLRTREDAEHWRDVYARTSGVIRQIRFALVLLPLD